MKEFFLPHDHGNKANTEDIRQKLEDAENFDYTSELFKQLSDSARVRIFWLLSHKEECVINISAFLDMSSPAVSHHLKTMKEFGIIESRREGKEVYYKIADTEACRLLHKTIEKIMEIGCPTEQIGHEDTKEETVVKVHEYLLSHIGERVTIEQLSKKFLMNPTTLKKAFKEKYGDSVAAHMNGHRMEMAAELLRESDKSIAEISSDVGFSGQSRFTEDFKKHFGVTPTEFRKEK